jgi:hypothetical protein
MAKYIYVVCPHSWNGDIITSPNQGFNAKYLMEQTNCSFDTANEIISKFKCYKFKRFVIYNDEIIKSLTAGVFHLILQNKKMKIEKTQTNRLLFNKGRDLFYSYLHKKFDMKECKYIENIIIKNFKENKDYIIDDESIAFATKSAAKEFSDYLETNYDISTVLITCIRD